MEALRILRRLLSDSGLFLTAILTAKTTIFDYET